VLPPARNVDHVSVVAVDHSDEYDARSAVNEKAEVVLRRRRSGRW